MFDISENYYNNFNVNILSDILDPTFKSFNEKNTIIVVHQNARSLRQSFDTLICELNAFHRLPDFIFVSEIWIYTYEVNDFCIPGYNFYAFPNDSYSAGGVGVFVKNSFNCLSFKCNFNSADGIKTTFELGNELFTFVCFYRLHATSIGCFIEELEAFLTNERSKNLFLVGDLNLDLLGNNDAVDMYLTLLAEHGLHSFLNVATRPTEQY